MIKIAVVSYNDEAPSSGLAAVFGPERQTIGRSEDNFLVLPDPKHYVSRTQAAVWSDGQNHMLVNLSQANPILINGQEIEAERDYPVHVGDQVQIGLYRLVVEATEGTRDSSARVATAAEAVADPAAGHEALEHADTTALLQAFLNGAGIGNVPISSGLTPELMETLGKLVASSIKGTMDLIALRALVKREVKAEVTMVVLRKNNPLKFFPDSQTVLIQMLRKKMPGFMAPDEALDDAFSDLHGHQLGVVAGMRAAMDAMLKRLHPVNFERRLPPPGFMDKMNPARAKAQLWEMYAEQFRGISLEAKDDFQTLFGKDFLNAYENEIERYKSGSKNG
ncbi:MAG: type secretion system-associated domain protein TagH [Pseudomonadota bacterium]|jgi:FHA domain-containing protein